MDMYIKVSSHNTSHVSDHTEIYIDIHSDIFICNKTHGRWLMISDMSSEYAQDGKCGSDPHSERKEGSILANP